MAWVALTCPQCSAPLPRVAIWRAVKCASCGALITRTEAMVLRDAFRQALNRLRPVMSGVVCGGDSYQLLDHLGNGESSRVHLARRIGVMPFLATVKLSSSPAARERFAREALVLKELRNDPHDGAAMYASLRLPEVIAQGPVEGEAAATFGIVMKHPTGFWGSLAALSAHFPGGVDPRHAVWIWRRMLDGLHFTHAQGWSHGNVRPEHALVHPRDHGVRLIGWSEAKKNADAADKAADLMRSARVVQVLLSGSAHAGSIPDNVPAVLADLVGQAVGDAEFCQRHGTDGLDRLLREAALTAFGPPTFVPLIV